MRSAWGDDAVHGWFGVPAGYAMIARRHMAEYGTTAEQLGWIAMACRKHGAANPHAPLRKTLTLDQHRPPRWWSSRCAATISAWCRTAAPRWSS